MPKSSLPFNPGEYALVATRITLFYGRHPTGRIVTELISRDRFVLFKASVYRSQTDQEPAATGWACEREGDSEINQVACVENTETSAIGRALANLGFTASTKRPSREEMEKADRVRSRLYKAPELTHTVGRVSENLEPTGGATREGGAAGSTRSDRDSDRIADLMELIREAGNRGMPASFLSSLQQRVQNPNSTQHVLMEVERRLRHWLLHRPKQTPESTHEADSTPNVNTPHH